MSWHVNLQKKKKESLPKVKSLELKPQIQVLVFMMMKEMSN